MEEIDQLDRDRRVRLSDAPRQSPRIVKAQRSPVRSVHPEMIVQSNSTAFAPDSGNRFEYSSESDGGGGRNDTSEKPGRHSVKSKRSGQMLRHTAGTLCSRCEEKRGSAPLQLEDYEYAMFAELPTSRTEGSDGSLPRSARDPPPIPSRNQERSRKGVYGRGSTTDDDNAMDDDEEDEHSPILQKQEAGGRTVKVDAFTLRTLMNKQALDDEPMAPQALHIRNSRYTGDDNPVPAQLKKVSILPPPIDTTRSHHLDPTNMVRTPFPHESMLRDNSPLHRNIGMSPLPEHVFDRRQSGVPHESLLRVSIRRSNTNRRRRFTFMAIPNNPSATMPSFAAASPAAKEWHLTGRDDFDDSEFFIQLRQRYNEMLGVGCRVFGAKTLARIVVIGPVSQTADKAYGWLQSPRSPPPRPKGKSCYATTADIELYHSSRTNRKHRERPVGEAFGEDKILRAYHQPSRVRGRYAWVSWAQRLAAAKAAATANLQLSRTPVSAALQSGRGALSASMAVPSPAMSGLGGATTTSSEGGEDDEGLEFVMSWSIARILAVFSLVLVLSLAATLLWIFLGLGGQSHGRFHGAAGRVETGLLFGIGVLLAGLAAMLAWIGGSWLVL